MIDLHFKLTVIGVYLIGCVIYGAVREVRAALAEKRWRDQSVLLFGASPPPINPLTPDVPLITLAR